MIDDHAPCTKCGKVHLAYNGRPGCAGHKSGKPDEPCSREPGEGSTVCATHGASAPQVKAKAEARLSEQKAREFVDKLGLTREIHPNDALLEEVYRSAGAVSVLDQIVQGLDRDDMVWGVSQETVKRSGENPGTDTTYAAVRNAWIVFWQDERKALATVSKMALEAGIDERRVRLAESQGALVADVVKRIFGAVLQALVDAGLPERFVAVFRAAVREVAPRELRALASGGGEDG